MSIETFGNGGVVVTGKDVDTFRLLSLKGMLKMECVGMKRSGPSAYSIIKREFNLKGNKESVLRQYEELLRGRGILIDKKEK